jgi:ATP-dependent DNA ligase
MRLREQLRPTGLPTKSTKLLSGGQWLHEIKHDGFRVMARKDSRECGSTAGQAMMSPIGSR